VLRLDASDGVEPWRAFPRPSRGVTGNKVLESESRTQAEELGVVVKEVGFAWLGWMKERLDAKYVMWKHFSRIRESSKIQIVLSVLIIICAVIRHERSEVEVEGCCTRCGRHFGRLCRVCMGRRMSPFSFSLTGQNSPSL
jgi:hypothetical protein